MNHSAFSTYSCIRYYMYEFFMLAKLLGGGGQNDMFAPPNIFIGGGGGRLPPCPPPPPPPRIDASGQKQWQDDESIKTKITRKKSCI